MSVGTLLGFLLISLFKASDIPLSNIKKPQLRNELECYLGAHQSTQTPLVTEFFKIGVILQCLPFADILCSANGSRREEDLHGRRDLPHRTCTVVACQKAYLGSSNGNLTSETTERSSQRIHTTCCGHYTTMQLHIPSEQRKQYIVKATYVVPVRLEPPGRIGTNGRVAR
ncbi:hypothetical protein EDC01DRAFT_631645 [Geopyxis carbonaria]|nr:hypothetical protein EDC01DRAFT_631645 [Geopyxis carbonaria]